MANLQINIDVSDEDFKKLCIENINDLPKDKLQDILLKAVEVALIQDKTTNDGKPLLMERVTIGTSWGDYQEYRPTELMKEIVKKIDTEKYLGDIVDKVGEYIAENYQSFIREYIVEAFVKILFTGESKTNLEYKIMSDIQARFNLRNNQ